MQAVIDRLGTIPALTGRTYGVAQLAQLSEKGALAQASPSAFVMSYGLRFGSADIVTGLFRQPVERFVGVVLAVKHAGDATGAKALAELDPLIAAVIDLLSGWGPGNVVDGVFVPQRGELVSIAAGTITYQLDFTIEDQLRIVRP